MAPYWLPETILPSRQRVLALGLAAAAPIVSLFALGFTARSVFADCFILLQEVMDGCNWEATPDGGTLTCYSHMELIFFDCSGGGYPPVGGGTPPGGGGTPPGGGGIRPQEATRLMWMAMGRWTAGRARCRTTTRPPQPTAAANTGYPAPIATPRAPALISILGRTSRHQKGPTSEQLERARSTTLERRTAEGIPFASTTETAPGRSISTCRPSALQLGP